MFSKLKCLSSVIAGLCFLAGANPVHAEIFKPETFSLDNGLQVVVISNHRAPIVTQMLWYKVGAADEVAGESGNAHFLEHLMFKGTKRFKNGEFSAIVAKNGGEENAFTSWDYTAYHQTVAKDRLALVMELEADRMTGLVLTDDIVLPEREVVREERRSRVDNNPAAQLGEVMQASQYLNHPYRIPVIGWDHEIEELSTETALRFYHKWYAPNNAVLIIAGDTTAEEVRPLAEKFYGVIPARDVPERNRISEPPQNAARRVELESKLVTSPTLSIRYLAPSYRTAEGNDPFALQVLDEIIGSGATSKLYKTLAIEEGTAASVGTSYNPGAYDLGSFIFYISPRPDIPLEQAESRLREEIQKIIETGVTAEDVRKAQSRMADAAVFARDPLSAAPNIFGRALTTGRTVADVENWPERIAEVTPEDVNRAMKQIVVANQSVTGVLLPAGLSEEVTE
ncbi:pitrilysin family protein [Kiloniella laminariae]|uniref:Pitrilysin family protein n=1 Tax=Kiloniella laminariae TaxID=454162 RepID=A0ABT4LP58_9PROT|nr:pitrilysin family protein [Kiloniella laminariae]MCZ4281742.1 pitrilysin family protein [Kiloniella laminariae]